MTLTTTQLIEFGKRVGRADDAILRVADAREAALNALSRATRGGTDPDGVAGAKELRGLVEGYYAAAHNAGAAVKDAMEDAAKYGLLAEARAAMYCPAEERDADWWTVRVGKLDRLVNLVKAAQTRAAEEVLDGTAELFGDPPLAEIKPARDAARKRLADIAAAWEQEVWESMP